MRSWATRQTGGWPRPSKARSGVAVAAVAARNLFSIGVKLRFRRPTKRDLPKDPWGRFRTGVGVLAMVLVLGTAGYVALGLDVLDAMYQTVITISTVGYREIGEVGDSYQIFTVLLILFGTGTSLYTLGVLIETMFEGRLDDRFRRRRMQRRIDRLTDHVVLCGYGQVGRAIEEELRRAGSQIVIIDRREPDHVGDLLMVTGEATDDAVLVEAGLDRAKTLVLALDTDVDNLFVCLTARTINPGVFIVARANESGAGPKLRRAGADRVVNPHRIGGARMASLVSSPEVAEFLDVVMRDGEFEVRLAEVDISPRSVFAECSLGQCGIRRMTGATVLAVRRGGSFVTNPPRDFVLMPDDVVIALGTGEQLATLRARSREV